MKNNISVMGQKVIDRINNQANLYRQYYLAGWADKNEVMGGCHKVEYRIRFMRSCGVLRFLEAEELELKAVSIFMKMMEDAEKEKSNAEHLD